MELVSGDRQSAFALVGRILGCLKALSRQKAQRILERIYEVLEEATASARLEHIPLPVRIGTLKKGVRNASEMLVSLQAVGHLRGGLIDLVGEEQVGATMVRHEDAINEANEHLEAMCAANAVRLLGFLQNFVQSGFRDIRVKGPKMAQKVAQTTEWLNKAKGLRRRFGQGEEVYDSLVIHFGSKEVADESLKKIDDEIIDLEREIKDKPNEAATRKARQAANRAARAEENRRLAGCGGPSSKRNKGDKKGRK